MSSRAQLKRGVLRLLFRVNKVFEGAEYMGGLPKGTDELPPPIFIIGAPRSGSTLFYQYLTAALKVGYLTNAHCLFFGLPSFLEGALHLSDRDQRSNFDSRHGKARGALAPSECGEYWYRFFRRKPQYVPGDAIRDVMLERMRIAVIKLVAAMRKPVVFKNMNCALRLEPLSKAFPRAVYLVTHRQLSSNARSLLQVRMRVHGSYAKWWSMEPPSIMDLLDKEPVEQVVRQVQDIHEVIERAERKVGSKQFYHISYERFCGEPAAEVRGVRQFLERNGIRVSARNVDLPSYFPLSVSDPLPEEYERELERLCE